VNYDNSLVVAVTVTCDVTHGHHLAVTFYFACDTIYRPPQLLHT